MSRELVFNQLNTESKQYLCFPDGRKKAVLVHILKDGECPCYYEEFSEYFTDRDKVYRRL